MTDNLIIFDEILEKFKFKEPVAAVDQAMILKFKDRALIDTLRFYGEYNLIYGFILKIFHTAKKTGLNLSVFQIKVITSLLAILVSAGIVIGALVFINKISITETDIVIHKRSDDSFKKEAKVISEAQIRPRISDNSKYRIGVESFTGPIARKTLDEISDGIYSELTKTKKGRIINLRMRDLSKNVNIILTGSVEKLGGIYIVAIKLVNVESSKVIFAVTDTIDDIKDIKKTYIKIADKIAQKLE